MEMDIISYLLALLETQKTVGITDLGTLYVRKNPGRYDTDLHAFLPPRHEIAFTSEILEEVELLNFISQKRNNTPEAASNAIAEFVANVKAALAEHQLADCSPVGTFKLIDDQIIFESSKKFQIGFDFYGLPPIATKTAETEPIEPLEEEPLTLVSEEILQTENEVVEPIWKPTVNERYEYNPEEEDDDDNGRGKRIFFKTLLILLIIAIAAAAVYFFYPNLLNNNLTNNHPDQEIEDASVVLVDTNAIYPADSVTTDNAKDTTTPLKELVKDSIPKTPLSNSITYEVIGSAMKSKKKVEEVIGNFQRRGINAKAIDALPGRLIKISLGSFTDYNLAKKFQDSLKVKLKNQEIYIQTIKPKN
jgi:nucleoid DNA-binding protein